jgi:hypothetical protein
MYREEMMMTNKLNHRNKLAKHHAEAHTYREEKRHVGNCKAARHASKRYNKAHRKASKLQLKRYGA